VDKVGKGTGMPRIDRLMEIEAVYCPERSAPASGRIGGLGIKLIESADEQRVAGSLFAACFPINQSCCCCFAQAFHRGSVSLSF